MKKYIAQPQYGTGTVNVYDITPGSTPQLLRALTPNADIQALTAAAAAAPNAGGLNSVLVYQDFSGQSTPQQCLLVAYNSPSNDNGVNLTPGAVYVFDLDAILKSGSGVLPAAAAATLSLWGLQVLTSSRMAWRSSQEPATFMLRHRLRRLRRVATRLS